MAAALNQWDAFSQAVIAGMAPFITFVDQFAFIGESTHFVKLPAVVSPIQLLFLTHGIII